MPRDYQDAVQSFAHMMLQELNGNSDKGEQTWLAKSPLDLVKDLEQHVAKLKAAVEAADEKKIAEHAADVGNQALFVADKFGQVSRYYRAVRWNRSIYGDGDY